MVYRSNSSNYTELSTPVLLGFGYQPPVLVLPASTQQVDRIVKCVAAQKGNPKLSVVGGGHNYAGYSFSGDVVMLSHNITEITIDDAKNKYPFSLARS